MSDAALREEMQQLRDQVAKLEAERIASNPSAPDDGLNGMRQLSRAVEDKHIGLFMLNHSMSDRVFWGGFWIIVVFAALYFVVDFIIKFT